jgi:hypothetical protein
MTTSRRCETIEMQPQHGQLPLPGEVELGRRGPFSVALLTPGFVSQGCPPPASDRVGGVGRTPQMVSEQERERAAAPHRHALPAGVVVRGHGVGAASCAL